MGSLDRRIGLDHESGIGLDHPIRLRFDRSCDGTATGHPLTHAYADVHSRLDGETWVIDDVPVNALDLKTMKILCTLATTYDMGGPLMDSIREVMRAAWGDDVVTHIMAVFVGDDEDYTPAAMALVALLKANAPLYGVL